MASTTAECERVVVLAPIPRGMRAASAVATQAARLTRAGAVVSPDQAARATIGRNVLESAGLVVRRPVVRRPRC